MINILNNNVIEIIVCFAIVLYILFIRIRAKEDEYKTNIKELQSKLSSEESTYEDILQKKDIEIDLMKYKINSLKRQLNKTDIKDEELNHIINNLEYKIRIDECHVNALIVQQIYGQANCKIIIGQASYLDKDGNKETVKNHLWNEYRKDIESRQIIEPANHLTKNNKKYFNHIGIELKLYDYLGKKMDEVQELIKNKETLKLIVYPNDDMN